MSKIQNLQTRARLRYAGWQNQQRITRLTREVEAHARLRPGQAPVVLFNASTRLTGLSLNAAFSMLTGWGLRLAGVPVVHFVCQSGLQPCVLGTNRQDYTAPPPCESCIAQSQRIYTGAQVRTFSFQPDPGLAAALDSLTTPELSQFEFPWADSAVLPLGELVLPSIRWALRRHHLPDDEPTRYLLRQYILSAYQVACDFQRLLEDLHPAAVVIFNGMMYPEATARWVSQQKGIRAITHEVGFQAFSTFFTTGHATAYPMEIDESFQLTPQQEARLDSYLEKRFQGKFTMAGIRFWPEMRGLDETFLEKASSFKQIVPVFTNVVYDTSQVHANVIFEHMFAWLDQVLAIIHAHPETLFVIRAHPDEMRPGTAKQSNESVRDWVNRNVVDHLPNVVFIDSQEYISSYELVGRSKFILVYNSSIGLEAALLGTPVLCAGKARYTQYPTVFLPPTPQAFVEKANELLEAGQVEIPQAFGRNARRVLYYQLYRASLPLERYIESGPRPGFVQLKAFTWQDLLPENSATMKVLINGIVKGKPFLLEDEE